MASLDSVADVDIDPSGKFKYILIEVEKGGQKKSIVRGYKWAGYHADIYDQVCSELEPKSFNCECVGGGRIEHNKNEQTLFVYGYSMGFGKANHEITVEKLKAWYPTYTKITFSDEGY
ncbi:14 kDa phosphohistidine phosphatase-like [Amphiura filiformis]|uniref:14 kDa phosphohistidine phosphatase-like n=1 Tax=Amphiura filiformis TaxID=82378 RepID=UPI003B2190F1